MQLLFYLKDLYHLLYYSVIRFVFNVTPFSLFIRYANLKGTYKYLLYSTFRKDVYDNVYQAFGDQKSKAELLRLTKSIIQGVQVWNICNYFQAKLSDAEIEGYFPVDGLENLEEALKSGKGVILLSGHLGPHFITRYILRKKGYQLKGVRFRNVSGVHSTKMETNSWFGKRIVEKLKIQRYTEPPDFYFKVEFNSRPLLKHLNGNSILFTMGDGMQSLTHIDTKFLNNTVPFSLGAMSLARVSGATVLPVIVSGKAGSKNFSTSIGKPLELQTTEDRQEDIRQNTLKFVCCLEEQILTYPSNWRHWVVRQYFTRINEFFLKEKNRHSKVLGLGRS